MDRLWRSFAMGILAVLLAAATLPALAFAKYPVIMGKCTRASVDRITNACTSQGATVIAMIGVCCWFSSAWWCWLPDRSSSPQTVRPRVVWMEKWLVHSLDKPGDDYPWSSRVLCRQLEVSSSEVCFSLCARTHASCSIEVHILT